jgi:hypothetical protein
MAVIRVIVRAGEVEKLGRLMGNGYITLNLCSSLERRITCKNLQTTHTSRISGIRAWLRFSVP